MPAKMRLRSKCSFSSRLAGGELLLVQLGGVMAGHEHPAHSLRAPLLRIALSSQQLRLDCIDAGVANALRRLLRVLGARGLLEMEPTCIPDP